MVKDPELLRRILREPNQSRVERKYEDHGQYPYAEQETIWSAEKADRVGIYQPKKQQRVQLPADLAEQKSTSKRQGFPYHRFPERDVLVQRNPEPETPTDNLSIVKPQQEIGPQI